MEVTGKPTKMPYWVTGFWQSKNRYRSCAEVLYIAGQYRQLGIPLSVLVIDEGSWDLLGDEGWGGCSNGSMTADGKPCGCFAGCAAQMTQQLSAMGIELMLSPYMQFVVQKSKNFLPGANSSAFSVGIVGSKDAGLPATIAYSGYNQAMNQGNADSDRCLNSTGSTNSEGSILW